MKTKGGAYVVRWYGTILNSGGIRWLRRWYICGEVWSDVESGCLEVAILATDSVMGGETERGSGEVVSVQRATLPLSWSPYIGISNYYILG